MGKKVKKNAQSGLKEKRVSTASQKPGHKENSRTSKIADDGIVLGKEKKFCSHFEKVVNLAKVSSKLESAESTGCEDCREGMIDSKGGKGMGRQGKKKGGSKATWICLHCGQFSCGGAGLPNSRQTHAVMHARQSRHPLVIQMENTNQRWCFACNTRIQVDKLDEDDNGEQKDVFSDIVKLLKNKSSRTTSMDMEYNNTVSLPNGTDFYAVRGLPNLGNTCFFNSVMQNLLAIDTLREYFLTFDGPMGPLTTALKKIYVQTSPESDLRNMINLQPLFGCICAKASQFRGYQQQDSHELLRCLLDQLSTEDLSAKKSAKSSRENVAYLPVSPTFIDTIFGGQISSTVCCVECGHSSVVLEPFLDLSLPLPSKKPPPKKGRPASRTKKTKLPPKRVSRHLLKLNKDGNSRPTLNSCACSSHTESSILKGGSQNCSSAEDLVESNVAIDGKCLGSQDYKSTQLDNASAQVSGCHSQEDYVVPLDYLGPVTQSETQEDSMLDNREPVPVSDDENLTVKSNDVLVSLDSGRNDVNHCIDSDQDAVNSSEKVDVDTGDENVKPQSTVDNWEDDREVQVKEYEVLLLTYKEDHATITENGKRVTEMSSSIVGDEENTLDFVGLGDLFDELEDAAIRSIDSNSMQEESLHLGNGFQGGNSMESDSDEVHSTDLPVSVESCLAHFVRTELLSGEHAWHCENCSKLQQEEGQKLKNRCKFAPVRQKHTSKDKCSRSNSVFVAGSNGSSGQDEKLKSHIPVQNNGFGPALPKEQHKIYDPRTACSVADSVSVCLDLPNEVSSDGNLVDCCNAYADQVPVERLSGFEEHESRENEEDDGSNSNGIKAMRNATKRMLINKSPTILTIHLKRFAQERRGCLRKLKGHVVFKEFIDLRPYLDKRSALRDHCIYRLVGVVEHSGSMKGGHYVAYVKGGYRDKRRSEEENQRPRHNVWYYASDAHVRETTLEQVLRSEAYILFYQKVKL